MDTATPYGARCFQFIQGNTAADIQSGIFMDRFDLGSYTRAISTSSEEAQRWFNLGLNWCYGFNHEEGVKCFLKAVEADPNCVMAHWGAAFGSGPFLNNVWRQFSRAEADHATEFAKHHLTLARNNSSTASDIENRLVDALSKRVQMPHAVAAEEFDAWDDAYADAMRAVFRDFDEDHDVM